MVAVAVVDVCPHHSEAREVVPSFAAGCSVYQDIAKIKKARRGRRCAGLSILIGNWEEECCQSYDSSGGGEHYR